MKRGVHERSAWLDLQLWDSVRRSRRAMQFEIVWSIKTRMAFAFLGPLQGPEAVQLAIAGFKRLRKYFWIFFVFRVSWQVQYFVDLAKHISWQVQDFVGLGVQSLWQAQDFLWALKCKFRGRCSTFLALGVQILWQA